MNPAQDLIVVIRSSGERTLNLCYESIINQVSPDKVHVIEEYPFEAALKTCYRLGAESNVKWLVTVDADMFLLPDAIERMLKNAERSSSDTFQLQGLIFDKLTYTYRNAGPRIFRTSLLKLALEKIPETTTQIRPEHETIQRMLHIGHDSIQTGEFYAFHDFEQYYSDIYRKAFVHARKHLNLASDLLKIWVEKRDIDLDYLVAIKGFFDSLMFSEQVSIDKRIYDEFQTNALRELGLKEKSPFGTNVDINDIVNKNYSVLFEIPDELKNCVILTKKIDRSRTQFIRQTFADKKLFRALLYLTGIVIQKTADYILKFANK